MVTQWIYPWVTISGVQKVDLNVTRECLLEYNMFALFSSLGKQDDTVF